MWSEIISFITGWSIGLYNGREMISSVTDRIPLRVWARILQVIGQGMDWRDRLVNWWYSSDSSMTQSVPTKMSVRRLYAFTKKSIVLLQEFDAVTSAHLVNLAPYLTVTLDSLPSSISFNEGADLLNDHQGYIVEYIYTDLPPSPILEETAYYYLLLPAETRTFSVDNTSICRRGAILPEFSEISLKEGAILLPEVFPTVIDAWAGADGQFGRFQEGWSQELLSLAFHHTHGKHLFAAGVPYDFTVRDPLSERTIRITYTPTPSN